MRKTVMERMDDAIKDLRTIKNRLIVAQSNGCYDSKIEYENAISDVEFAIDNIKESKLYVKKAEKEKKKCKY